MGRDVAHEEIVDEGIPQVPERGFGVGLDSFRGQKVAKPGLSDNPYFHLPQGFDPSRYYGSQVWTDLTLQNASAHPPRPIEFTGLPGMGKSTYLRYLAHPQGALDKNRRALHPPFSDEPWLMFMVLAEFRLLPTDAHPFEYLYERFCTAYENHKAVHKSNLDQWPDVLPINDKLSPDDATSLIEDFLTILKRIGVRAVFLLDDFHLAFKTLSLAQTTRLRPWRDRAAFVISTEYRLEKVNAQAAGSPFFQTLPSVPFGGLMTTEAKRLLEEPATQADRPFSPEDIEFTLTQAGTHPHLLIGAGAVLWTLRDNLRLPENTVISRDHQQMLVGHFKERFIPTFQMYTEHLEESEKRALIATAKNEDLDKHYPALAYLEKLGLVQLDTNKTVKYGPFSPLFGEYIKAADTIAPILQKDNVFAGIEGSLYDLLRRDPDKVYSFDDLSQGVWGESAKDVKDPDQLQRRVQVAVSRLRKKLQESGIGDVISVRGKGYKLVP